jgi:hypothetical protein
MFKVIGSDNKSTVMQGFNTMASVKRHMRISGFELTSENINVIFMKKNDYRIMIVECK